MCVLCVLVCVAVCSGVYSAGKMCTEAKTINFHFMCFGTHIILERVGSGPVFRTAAPALWFGLLNAPNRSPQFCPRPHRWHVLSFASSLFTRDRTPGLTWARLSSRRWTPSWST